MKVLWWKKEKTKAKLTRNPLEMCSYLEREYGREKIN